MHCEVCAGTSRKVDFDWPDRNLATFRLVQTSRNFTLAILDLNKHKAKQRLLALSIQPNMTEMSRRGQMVRNFLGKFPENPEIVEFPESKPLKRKHRKFGEKY